MDQATAKADKINKEVGRTASKEVRKQQLIDATIESIAKHGVASTTTATVTRLAGLSIGLVNFHFDSKENLYQETLRFLAHEHRDQWKKDFERAGDDLAAQMSAIVDSHFHPKLCNRKKLSVWFGFYGETSYRKRYRTLMQEVDAERWDTLRNICVTLKAQGGYDAVDPDVVVRTLEGLFDGLCLNFLMYPSEFSREDSRRQIKTYLAGVFPQHFPTSQAP